MQNILVVEDDIDIQEILNNYLTDAGYKVIIASDGVAGIAKFNSEIDLVLLDIMLPKIDGYGVCEVIRQKSKVPIIMLTALSDEENQLRGFEQQIDDYIPKPFSPKILLCKIAAILRRGLQDNIDDEYGNTLYPSNVTTEQDMVTADSYVTFDGSNTTDENVVSTEKDTKAYQFSLKNGASYTLVVITDLYVVRQSTEVLLSTFPYVIVMVFILSILCALFYSRFITRPVLKLSATSKQMASLDFSGRCDETRSDELGCLAHNLNCLSDSLSHSMLELQEANAQLKTDIEKERELERQRMDFFGAASHELKTPLTVLKGHLSGMLNGVVGYENHSKYLQRSLAVTEKMEVLIRELLYISRIEKNKTSIQFANIDFAELLRTVIAELTDFISEKKLSLHINIPDRVSCPLDRAEMERAIQNILINAIRYSPDGEQVIVTVTETNTIISCSIENTGVKIPETTICHLFEPFYRVDISRNSATGGTGLGLYIVRGILENHNAEYGIKNTENGVCFWLRLPKKQ